MYGNKIAVSEYHPERSVIGAIERTGNGNVVLRIGRIWTNDPDRGWQQTEHVVLKPGEIPELLREVVDATDPPHRETLTLKLDRDLARDLLDKLVGNQVDSERYARLHEQVADFVHDEPTPGSHRA
jgi:hypothetical protein